MERTGSNRGSGRFTSLFVRPVSHPAAVPFHSTLFSALRRPATEPGRSSFVLRSYSSPVPSPLPTTLRLATLPTGLSLCSLPTPSRPVSPLRSPYAPFVRSLSRRAEGRDGARLTLLTASGSLVTPVVVSPLVSHRPPPNHPTARSSPPLTRTGPGQRGPGR